MKQMNRLDHAPEPTALRALMQKLSLRATERILNLEP